MRPNTEAIKARFTKTDRRLDDGQTMTEELVERAALGLPQMLDSGAGLFCHRLRKVGHVLVQEGVSPRYTAIALLGLHRLERAGVPSPVDGKVVLQRLLAKTDWVDNLGDVGLLLWLCACVTPDKLDELERRLMVTTALSQFVDARQGETMHLAWFLTGLSYSSLASGTTENRTDVARGAYNLLAQNQGERGYFGHLAGHRSMRGLVRGHIGSFADQIYPIYALTQFFRAFSDHSALERAQKCALAVCHAQGPLGQWWWHYDSRTGRVLEEYPVFSVHQHGMAPMALFALGDASGTDFDSWVYKGLDWIRRRNELAADMEDVTANVIWRCIRPSSSTRFTRAMFGLRRNGRDSGVSRLHIVYECRPYELGWLLYGLADHLRKTASFMPFLDHRSFPVI